MSVRAYPTGPARPGFAERASFGVLVAMLACIVLLGLKLAMRSRGLVPDYDALSYVDFAMRTHLALTGLGDAGHAHWPGLHFTNTLDAFLLGVAYDLVDAHVGVWILHTAYLVLFAALLRRLLGAPAALLATAWAAAGTLFFHQYTSFISEMKVGLLLVLFVAYLFHPDAAKHRAALFWITVLLLLARTIDLLFVGPLCVVFAALRWLDRPRRGEILPALAPVALAVAVLLPVFWITLPKLFGYVEEIGVRTRQSWIDMSGVHGKGELAWSYLNGLRASNAPLQAVALLAALAAAAFAFTRKRERLRPARDAAIAALIVFAVLMQASVNNNQVFFWLFALEGLLVALIARALAPAPLVAAAATVLAAAALAQDYRAFVADYAARDADAPVYRAERELAAELRPLDNAVVYQNYSGVGPLDARGLEVALGRVVGWPPGDQTSYRELPHYLAIMARTNVAFIANRNFLWPDYVGVNHHTAGIARYVEDHAAAMGWIHTGRILFDGDPGRYFDVYRRPGAKVKLKWPDPWLDVATPVALDIPGGGTAPAGSVLELRVELPRTQDASFAPPVAATLRDASGKAVAAGELRQFGENTLRLPIAGLGTGAYVLAFDKSFASADPRQLVATLRSAGVTAPPAP